MGSYSGDNFQGPFSVAIGYFAGWTSQGTNSVSIGFQTGTINQGSTSIAIGYRAGNDSQPRNSIILNASNDTINGSTSGLYISPVRNTGYTTSGNTLLMYYNSISNEITSSIYTLISRPPLFMGQSFNYPNSASGGTFSISLFNNPINVFYMGSNVNISILIDTNIDRYSLIKIKKVTLTGVLRISITSPFNVNGSTSGTNLQIFSNTTRGEVEIYNLNTNVYAYTNT
jgi:hypothetical protein